MSIGVKEYDVFRFYRNINRGYDGGNMTYVIAFFVLVFFSIFCGWVVAAIIDEEEARELEELEGEIGEKSLRV